MGVESANKTNRPLEVMSQIWRSPSPEIRDSVSTTSTTRPNPSAGHRRRVRNAVQIAVNVARAIRLVIERERERDGKREKESTRGEACDVKRDAMRSVYKLFLLCLILAALIILLNVTTNFSNKLYDQTPASRERLTLQQRKAPASSSASEVTICVVVCGDRLHEALTMLKSALVFANRPLQFVILADNNLIPAFSEKLSEWRLISNKTFDFLVRPITFPDGSDVAMWKKLFKPCAAQRLFLPTVLNDTDAVLYVDTDTLFLAPPDKVWDEFKKMNSSQLAALSPEHEDPNTGWYNRFAKHPYYGKLGVNSGVMLMNLTRMREFRWTDHVIPIHKEYKLKITWGDQDIINIIFHHHPEKLYVYSCRYNYRPDHCMYMSVCAEAEKDGALVLHGSRGTFHSPKQPPFRAVYRAMQEYPLNADPYDELLVPMRNYLAVENKSNCGRVSKVFITQPELHLAAHNF